MVRWRWSAGAGSLALVRRRRTDLRSPSVFDPLDGGFDIRHFERLFHKRQRPLFDRGFFEGGGTHSRHHYDDRFVRIGKNGRQEIQTQAIGEIIVQQHYIGPVTPQELYGFPKGLNNVCLVPIAQLRTKDKGHILFIFDNQYGESIFHHRSFYNVCNTTASGPVWGAQAAGR
jgi:hypothetical protein